ncbi:MAG: VirB3 family type IV secretion system protein [Gammaproteobacteria bacterium]
MNNDEYFCEVDYLAVGLTKSPMFMGVNIKMFFANIAFSVLICIDAHTPLGIPFFIVSHLFMVKSSMKEPNFLYIWVKSYIKTPPILNFWYWGKTNSYEAW